MSAFDFGDLHERRRAERQAKLRKKLAIAGFSTLLLVVLAAAVGFVAYRSNHAGSDDGDTHKKEEAVTSSSKAIKMMCAPTDYKLECESSLSKRVGKDSSSHDAKDLLIAAVTAASDEVKKGFQSTSKFKKDTDPKVKGAIDDCKELFGHAKDELNSTLSSIQGHSVRDLPRRSPDLRNWLSAVMSYQQTCIDGFPEGSVKSSMEEGMKSARKMTSNALAIIQQASELFSMSSKDAPESNSHRRRLLEEDHGQHHGTILKEVDKVKLKPNALVAKDGSGDHKTISQALAAMPKKRNGRYVVRSCIHISTLIEFESIFSDSMLNMHT